MSGMDVWVQGWGLIALWVTAVAAVVTMLFVWSIWVSVQKSARAQVETAKSPAQPGG